MCDSKAEDRCCHGMSRSGEKLHFLIWIKQSGYTISIAAVMVVVLDPAVHPAVHPTIPEFVPKVVPMIVVIINLKTGTTQQFALYQVVVLTSAWYASASKSSIPTCEIKLFKSFCKSGGMIPSRSNEMSSMSPTSPSNWPSRSSNFCKQEQKRRFK